MNEILLSPEAEAEIDDIWLYVARESRGTEIASRVVDGFVMILHVIARGRDLFAVDLQ